MKLDASGRKKFRVKKSENENMKEIFCKYVEKVLFLPMVFSLKLDKIKTFRRKSVKR